MNKTKDLIFIAFYAAMATVLEIVSGIIPFLQMPQGGSIQLGVIPVLVASYHLGYKKGACTGILWWLIVFLMGGNNWFVDPMQYVLDYIFPCAVCGMAACFPKIGKNNLLSGVTGVMVLKFIFHILSGVYYWPPEGAAQGSLGAWIYSLTYNFGYNFATLLIAIVLVPMLFNRIAKNTKEFTGLKNS